MEHEKKAGKVVTIPFDPEAPHPDLIEDTAAMESLPESRKGEVLWTLKKKVSPQPPMMERVEKKARFRSPTRICPRHGVVQVLSRNYRPKAVTDVESLSCGHTLLIYRILGALKSTSCNTRLESSYLHRGWLFTYKETYNAPIG